MPTHVDPRRLPKRCYWDGRDRVWYTIHPGAKAKRQRIADAKATLADLHRIMEDLAGIARGTVSFVMDEFHKSAEYRSLAPQTRDGYDKQRGNVCAVKTRAGTLGALVVDRINTATMQVLLDAVAVRTPTKANHMLRYLRRVFTWGVQRGHCATNPCRGVAQAKERQLRRLPDATTVAALLTFCRAGADGARRRAGAIAPYLWICIELAYLCRLRGAELLLLTDASAGADGVYAKRVKGSRDNVVRWTPRLRAVWTAATALRDAIWQKRRSPVPIAAADRPLLLNEDGTRLRKGALDSAWQHMIHAAINAEVITPEQRFALHDLKRRGITDTAGTRGEKQLASGHKSEQMLEVYDFSLPLVNPAGE
jgi:site-specific recombinase XerC